MFPDINIFSLDFIRLDDPSYQEGTMNLSIAKGILALRPNQSRLFGIANRHRSEFTTPIEVATSRDTKLYLVADREHSKMYSDFLPLPAVLNMQHWRALLFHDYVYLLSGLRGGMVYYFKLEKLSVYDDRFSLVLWMANMSYARFFGCPRAGPMRVEEEPKFPSDKVFQHARYWSMTFCK